MSDSTLTGNELFSAVVLTAKPGQAAALAEIGRRFAAACRRSEPGLKSIRIHQSVDNPADFLVYETFADAAAFKAHFETAHFKGIVEPEIVPIVSRRERTTYRSL
ncbi:MAG: antibiotic biosynthesis monooxygenase [Alphaproteobacteria bacterium]|nr:antibiotic biosynthesis monooxygenase [Alphaproteobacteria bacterium]